MFEALASGKPIVATDADGLLDILDGRTRRAGSCRGVTRPRWPAPSCTPIDHPDERAAHGARRARASARDFDIAAFVRKMERLYALLHDLSRPTQRQGILQRRPVVPESGRAGMSKPAFGSVAVPRPSARPLDARPGLIVAAIVLAIYGGLALSVDFPHASYGFQSDEATYYMMAHSLARDGDLDYRRAGSGARLARVSERSIRRVSQAGANHRLSDERRIPVPARVVRP